MIIIFFPSAISYQLSAMTPRRRSSVLGHDIIPHSFHLNERRTVRSPLCEALFELGVGDSNAQPTDKVPFRGFEVRKTNDRFLLKRRRPRGDSNAQPTDSKTTKIMSIPYIRGCFSLFLAPVVVKDVYFVHFFYHFYTSCTTVAPGIIWEGNSHQIIFYNGISPKLGA